MEIDVASLKEDQAAIKEWSEKQPDNPTLDIKGPVLLGTVISGAHSTITIDKDYESIIVLPEYTMKIFNQ